jgi:predicted nucleic acid-binding protein
MSFRACPSIRNRRLRHLEPKQFSLSAKNAVYDAAYLELADHRQFPLGTLDTELRKAAQAEGVEFL